MEFVIGVNGGGSHTDLLAVSRDRQVLARIETGPTNYHNVGVAATEATIRAAITDLIAQSGQSPADLIALSAGLSGLGRQPDHEQFAAIFESICPGVPQALDNDAIIALIAGVGRPFGVVEISGTGSIGYGVNKAGERARCGGWGYHLDEGGGYGIGHQALIAVARAFDGSGPQTVLTERILSRLGLRSPEDLVEWMYTPERAVPEFAALAAEVAAAADAEPSDLVAVGILMRAADALAENALTVAHKLAFDGPFPVVLSGSLLLRCVTLRERFIEVVQARQPQAVPIAQPHDPAFGAALMALVHIGDPWPDGVELRPPRQPRITEKRNRLTVSMAQRPTLELLTLMNFEDRRIADVVAPELPKLAALIDAAAERFLAGGRLIMAGAGTSGRLAVLDAVECRPTFGVGAEQVIGLIAGGQSALTGSVEEAEDSESGGQAAIAGLNVTNKDIVVGVAASGATPFVIGVVQEAKARGALVGSVSNVSESPIAALATHAICAPVGPEVLTGSTRLRAGTAEKLILNMLTTGMMVRAGRTFGNLMTDMQMSNSKLRNRARVIVAEAIGSDTSVAERFLASAGGEMKTAIVMAHLNVSADDARRLLIEYRGDLNRLLLSPSQDGKQQSST